MVKAFLLLIFTTLTATAAQAEGQIEHVVLCWLAEGHNEKDVLTVKDGFRAFESIPQIASMVIGEPLPSERPIVDDSFHVGVVMKFHNAEDLEAFMVDETHKQITHDTLAPLCPKAVVYDIVY